MESSVRNYVKWVCQDEGQRKHAELACTTMKVVIISRTKNMSTGTHEQADETVLLERPTLDGS